MTDPQFQPGQPTPPTQGGGVFGGNPEEIVHDVSMFGPLQKDEPKKVEEVVPFGGETSIVEDIIPTSPFDGFVIPQDAPVAQEVVTEPVVEEPVVAEPIVEEPVVAEPVVEEPVVAEPVVETVVEEIKPTPEQSIVEETPEIIIPTEPVVEEPVVEEPITQPASDIQQKFTNLLDNVSELTSLLRLKDGEVLEIIGSNNDKVSVLYQFGLNEQNEVHVKRIETEKEEDETTFNELKLGLNPESNLFEIFLDDVLLFEESDLTKDTKKKSQVIEKINKLIFLTESKLKDTEKELRAKQEEEEERRRLQDIFRNF